MKTKALITVLTLAVLTTVLTGSTLAYGGNGAPGFPPPAQVKLVCKYEIIELPFDRTVQVPRCHIEHIQVSNDDKGAKFGFETRFQYFLARLFSGHK